MAKKVRKQISPQDQVMKNLRMHVSIRYGNEAGFFGYTEEEFERLKKEAAGVVNAATSADRTNQLYASLNSMSLDRSSIQAQAIAILLDQGFSYKKICSPEMVGKRREAFEQAIKNVKDLNGKEQLRLFEKAMQKTVEEFDAFVADPDNVGINSIMSAENMHMRQLVVLAQDFTQEYDKVRAFSADPDAAKKRGNELSFGFTAAQGAIMGPELLINAIAMSQGGEHKVLAAPLKEYLGMRIAQGVLGGKDEKTFQQIAMGSMVVMSHPAFQALVTRGDSDPVFRDKMYAAMLDDSLWDNLVAKADFSVIPVPELDLSLEKALAFIESRPVVQIPVIDDLMREYAALKGDGKVERTPEQREAAAVFTLGLGDSEVAELNSLKNVRSVWSSIENDFDLDKNIVFAAKTFYESGLDISKPEQLALLQIVDKDTGSLRPLDFAPKEMTKANAVEFLQNLERALSSGETLMNVSQMQAGRPEIMEITFDGAYHFKIAPAANSFKKPAEVAKPNFFKMITNSWFGWFKQDVDRYNGYLSEKTVYDGKVRPYLQADELVERNKEHIEKAQQVSTTYRRIRNEINEKATGLEKMAEAAREEQARGRTIEVVTGRSRELLGRHANYVALTTEPLVKSDVLPVEGLSLIASCSLAINRDIRDASTQVAQTYNPKEGETLSEEDKAFLAKCAHASERANVLGKIMESLYCGADIQRMGDRATAVLEGRRQLNLAVQAYEAGNKEPLANLLKDSVEVLYTQIKNASDLVNTKASNAVIEMVGTLDTLFAKDKELMGMVGVSDERMKFMKGAAKYYEMVINPKQRAYESFKKYMVPGAEDKAAFVREVVYRGYLTKLVQNEVKGLREASIVAGAAKTQTEQRELVAKFEGQEQSGLINSMQIYFSEAEMKESTIYQQMATNPDFEKQLQENFEREIMSTPEYQKLLTLSPEELQKTDFDKIPGDIFEGRRKAAEKAKVMDELGLKKGYVEQQKKLGQMLVNPTEFTDGKGINTPEGKEAYMNNIRTCIATMVTYKQLDAYIDKKWDTLRRAAITNLAKPENLSAKAEAMAKTPAMEKLLDPSSSFAKPKVLAKLAIGAEKVIDPQAQPAAEATSLSEQYITELTSQISQLTGELLPVDKVVKAPSKAPAEASPAAPKAH